MPPLDAYSAGVLRLMRGAWPDLGGTVVDVREARRLHRQARYPAGPAVALVEDRVIEGAPPVPVRIYRPHTAAASLPVVVYFHGGGFVLGDLETHDGVCRLLAAASGAVVVSVDYRRAPENPFPAAVQDAYAALRWAYGQAPSFGGDSRRLAVAGDSAGGNLAAVTCIRARDEQGPPIALQLLIYPVTDCRARRVVAEEGCLLTAAHLRWFGQQYLNDPASADDPWASPLRTRDLSALPPAVVLTVEHDPLRDEGEAFAARLADAGVPVEMRRFDGIFHGAFGLGALMPRVRPAEEFACHRLRAHLTPSAEAPPAALPARGPGADDDNRRPVRD